MEQAAQEVVETPSLEVFKMCRHGTEGRGLGLFQPDESVETTLVL